jgi:hypothetical protein
LILVLIERTTSWWWIKDVDTFVSIENILGSRYADTFKGNNSVSNTFNGGTTTIGGVLENSSDENDTVSYVGRS